MRKVSTDANPYDKNLMRRLWRGREVTHVEWLCLWLLDKRDSEDAKD